MLQPSTLRWSKINRSRLPVGGKGNNRFQHSTMRWSKIQIQLFPIGSYWKRNVVPVCGNVCWFIPGTEHRSPTNTTGKQIFIAGTRQLTLSNTPPWSADTNRLCQPQQKSQIMSTDMTRYHWCNTSTHHLTLSKYPILICFASAVLLSPSTAYGSIRHEFLRQKEPEENPLSPSSMGRLAASLVRACWSPHAALKGRTDPLSSGVASVTEYHFAEEADNAPLNPLTLILEERYTPTVFLSTSLAMPKSVSVVYWLKWLWLVSVPLLYI